MLRRIGNSALLFAILSIGQVLLGTDVNGQVTDQRRENRRAFVEDLLRGLIESQVPDERAQPRNRPGRQQIPEGQRVGRPVIEVTPEMISVRQYLNQMAGEYDTLIREIQSMESRSPHYRPLMADALQVRASVDSLARKAQLYPRVDGLVPDYQTIDRNYRVLAHRLRQAGQLSNKSGRCLDRIDQIDTRLCDLFGIQPQINRRELLRLTTALRSDFQHMLQDLYYESNQHPELRPVLQDGKRLLANINQATGLISTAQYPTIVASFKGCHKQWRDFNRQLYQFPSERILRDVQHVEMLGAQIRDQLYLESEIDREYLAFLASAVNSGTTGVLDLVTMTHLLAHPAPNQLIGNARELCAMGETLRANIVANQSVEDLSWDYRLFDVQWATMHDQLSQLKDTLIDQKLNDINYTVSTLRRTFGDGPAMSVDQMTQLTASLDQLTYQLEREVDQRVAAGSYNGGIARSVRRQTHRLHESVHQLELDLASGQNVQSLSTQVRQVCQTWDKTTAQLAKLNERDRQNLAFYRSQIEPMMVKLKLVFTN